MRGVPMRTTNGQSDGPDNLIVEPDAFYRNFFYSLRNGVIAIWRDGSIAVVNDAAYRILGLHANPKHIGRSFHDVLGRNHDLSGVLSLAFTDAALPNRAELRLGPAGTAIGYTLCRIADRDSTVLGAALLFKDLTRVEQLEERERLRDRLAARGEMAAAIAHEVKNPLAGIQVMAGVLKRQLPNSPDAAELLNDIINEAKMANRIVVDVLEFVRPINLEAELVPVTVVLDETVAAARSRLGTAYTSIVTDYAADLPDLDADRLQLRQLFANLLTNAIEALAGRGHILITAFYTVDEESPGPTEPPDYAGHVTVEVADDGSGVPGDVIDRLFGPFVTTKPSGSGLGLAIVRKIIDAHDGRIDIKPRAGGGAIFRVRLPVSHRAVEATTAAGDDRTAGGTHV